MANYKHIYIDLDRTLWDFEKNSFTALKKVFHLYNLENYYSNYHEFIDLYHIHNERLWQRYREGNIKKEVLRYKRFELTLAEKNIKNHDLAVKIGESYLSISVEQTHLFPNAHEMLTYLQKKYSLYILTNGFRETQFSKLRNCNLEKYFNHVFTSETIGYNKPHPKIFQWALSYVNAKKEECLMIGDDQEVDIKGSNDFGIDSVFFNPMKSKIQHRSSYVINDLIELNKIL